MGWHAIGEWVKTIGGVVGLIGGGLGIYTTIATHRIQRKRLRQEEATKSVDQRADDMRRQAHEIATSIDGGSLLREVTLSLRNDLDRKAAWKLCKEGHARVKGDQIDIDVDQLPMIARGWRSGR